MSDSARFNMIETQIRPADVTDVRIHAAMSAVAREKFVPSAAQALAYADVPVAVAPGRYLLDPAASPSWCSWPMWGRTTGSSMWAAPPAIPAPCWRGWRARWLHWSRMPIWYALPASCWPMFKARLKWCRAGLVEGVRGQAPFDVIFVNGAIEQVPDTLFAQLAEGGRLVAVLKDGQSRAWLHVKENGQIGRRPDFDADVPLLAGFKKAMGFIF